MPGIVKNNLYLNAKLALPENSFGTWQPGLSVGVLGVGFEKDVSDFNVLHAEVGKTLPFIGTLAVGGYYGMNEKLLVSSQGKKQQAGFLAAWTSPDVTVGAPGLNKINFAADVQTGKNIFGAAGTGIGLYFTPSIDILTGPVWFLDTELFKKAYGTAFMWSVQLDVDIEFKKQETALAEPTLAPT